MGFSRLIQKGFSLPPNGVRKIAPRSGSGFGLRLALELGLGGGGNFPQGNFPRIRQTCASLPFFKRKHRRSLTIYLAIDDTHMEELVFTEKNH